MKFIFVVTFQTNPSVPVAQANVDADTFEVQGDTLLFYRKREVVTAIRGFITVTRAVLEDSTPETITVTKGD